MKWTCAYKDNVKYCCVTCGTKLWRISASTLSHLAHSAAINGFVLTVAKASSGSAMALYMTGAYPTFHIDSTASAL